MALRSVAELMAACEIFQKPLWEVILMQDLEIDTPEARTVSMQRMDHMWSIMCASVKNYDKEQHSFSGLVGGDGARYLDAMQSGNMMCGHYFNLAIATALKVSECNACMKRIVAAPTAGSCGVIPAALIPYQEEYHTTKEDMLHALYVAGGFGNIIAERASISGAEAGCQAEIGAASAMAAAALTFLCGGTPEACENACAMALKNLLGLVCDPVAGLVEVPCVKRNVVGVVNAIACANMAISGITSRIPADEVIDAMGDIGRHMPETLRETATGGLAVTPTAQKVVERFSKTKNNFYKKLF